MVDGSYFPVHSVFPEAVACPVGHFRRNDRTRTPERHGRNDGKRKDVSCESSRTLCSTPTSYQVGRRRSSSHPSLETPPRLWDPVRRTTPVTPDTNTVTDRSTEGLISSSEGSRTLNTPRFDETSPRSFEVGLFSVWVGGTLRGGGGVSVGRLRTRQGPKRGSDDKTNTVLTRR